LTHNIEYRMDGAASLQAALVTADARLALGELPPNAETWTTLELAQHRGESSHAEAASGVSNDVTDWNDWIVASPEAAIDIADGALSLRWTGAPGPYLVTTAPLLRAPHELVLLPVRVSVQSGRLGFGALNSAGQWVRTFEFDELESRRVLEFPAGDDGALTLVLYSAAPGALSANLRIESGDSAQAQDASVNTKGVYGAGDIRMLGFRVFNDEDKETPVLNVARSARLEFDYRIARSDLKERAQIVFAFKRNGVDDVYRVFQRDFLFDAETACEGTVSACFERLPLAPGSYSITVLIAAENYYDQRQTMYFSVNPAVYFAQSNAAEISVQGWSQLHEGASVIGDADWRMKPKAVENPRRKGIA
jgi:hypothetical protein